MRIQKSLLLILLLSFGLTGCYTQLEYSQKMNKVTDDRTGSEYSWSDDSDEKADLTEADSIYIAETYGAKVAPYKEGEYNGDSDYTGYEDEEYIPVHYKDYDVVETYEACGCNPYKTYVIYDSYYPSSLYHGYGYSYNRYHHWPSYYAFGNPYYHWRSHFSFGYFHQGFGLAFHWGYPYSYYDPFFYDPFYYGYSSPIFYNNYYFGSGFAGNVRTDNPDRRNGRRSIGTNRVGSRDRNSSSVRTRSGLTREKATGRTVRSRSNGVERSRSRGTVQRNRGNTTRTQGTTRVGSSSRTRSESGTKSRGTVKRSRSGKNGSGTQSRSRSRVRNNDEKRDQALNSRNRLGVNRNIVLPRQNSREQIESRVRQQRVKTRYNRQTQRRSIFGRFKSVFDNGNVFERSKQRSGTRSFKLPNQRRSKIGNTGRSSRSSSRSSVTRSRSSSKSSGTRSRSSSSRGSSNNRDRNNN